MADDESIEEDFIWARAQYRDLEEDPGSSADLEEMQEALEQQFLEAVNSLEENGVKEDEAEEAFREMVRKLQTEAYFAGVAFGVRNASTDGADSITAVINADDATEIIKALVSRSEIPLTIRVIAD